MFDKVPSSFSRPATRKTGPSLSAAFPPAFKKVVAHSAEEKSNDLMVQRRSPSRRPTRGASDLRIVLGPRLVAVKDWIANWHSSKSFSMSSGMADSKQAVEGRLLMPARHEDPVGSGATLKKCTRWTTRFACLRLDMLKIVMRNIDSIAHQCAKILRVTPSTPCLRSTAPDPAGSFVRACSNEPQVSLLVSPSTSSSPSPSSSGSRTNT